MTYITHFQMRDALWGPYGALDSAAYSRLAAGDIFALYRYNSATAFVDFVFGASLTISIFYMLGVYPRILSWAFMLTTYSTFARDRLIADGGEVLLILLAFALCFADSGRYLCLFQANWRLPTATRVIGNVAHNCAVFAIFWQVAIVYAVAAFYKIRGDAWVDGTALYYILNNEHFALYPRLLAAVTSHPVVVALMTYSVVFFECSYCFLIWNKRARRFLTAASIAFHTGIALFMGLLSFGATMIVVNVALLSDPDLARISTMLGKVFRPVSMQVNAHAEERVTHA